MSFYKKIEQLFTSYHINRSEILPGHLLKPNQVNSISETFTQFNLKDEEIVLAFKRQNLYFGILSDKYLYITNLERIPLESCRFEIIQPHFKDPEIQFILACIKTITGVKKELGKSLEGFLEKYRGLVENAPDAPGSETAWPHFDPKYLEMIGHEAAEALAFCQQLNQDARFLQALNMVFSPGDQALDGYKTEHLLLSDLIKVYNTCAIQENEKSKFTLAYFFEKLQGKDLSKNIGIERLNQMVSKPGFNENIQKIKTAQLFRMPKEFEKELIIPSLLHKLQHDSFARGGNIIYRFATIIAKADHTISEEEKLKLKEILQKTTNITQTRIGASSHASVIPQDDSLEKVMAELNSLVGLEEVKKSIQDLINYLKVSRMRVEKEMPSLDISLHSVFLGPPGTGKTTIARLLGRIFKHLGYLSTGQLVETDRAGMVAGYVGQTAIKVDELVTASKGGVLFIDEAYALTPQDNSRDFGSEAIDTLLKRMEDNRDDLVVIAAGYTEPMKFFIESNPGLRSRFNRYYKFDHFYPVQLVEIFQTFCRKYNFTTTPETNDKLLDTFELLYEKRDEGFGNARVVRNLFEICLQNQANRIIALSHIDAEILQTFVAEDIPEPKTTVDKVYMTQPAKD